MNENNPFDHNTPDGITAEDIVDLFVPVFGEYYNIPSPNHTFINGSRGSGKSMIFRFMEPDCQLIDSQRKKNKAISVSDLEYFAIHIPIKEGALNVSELDLIKGQHGDTLLNEHYMVIRFAIKIFSKLKNIAFPNNSNTYEIFDKFYNEFFIKKLWYAGYEKSLEIPSNSVSDFISIIDHILNVLDQINRDFTVNYVRKLITCNSANAIGYNGIILTFVDFLYPILKQLRTYEIFPKKPFYLLIDDADNLSLTQTMILNSWVSLRTIEDLCFKISTQQKYKTYVTINSSRIDTPHDYSEINISDIYTSEKGLYKSRVSEAIVRRLKKYGYVDISPEQFFPENEKQEKKIQALFLQYKEEKNYDFAYRYARPDYIKNLEGNRNTYSYAGFNQLVNISSGTMREFIEFARKMFAKELAKSQNKSIKIIKISPSIQNEVVREYSNWYMYENFEKISTDTQNTNIENDNFKKLRNLITALGETFKLILLSDASERRVFSFAIQDTPSNELEIILKLGVRCGYFQRSTISNKMGSGRTKLYILNRLLAPHFLLDPTSFAGYKFLTSEFLTLCMKEPLAQIRKVYRSGIKSLSEQGHQLTLFSEYDYEND